MEGGFTMLEYIYSVIALVILFFFVSFVLVKLYKHGIRDWFVYASLVVFSFIYFFSRPDDYVFSNTEKWIFTVVTFACIFTVDSGSSVRFSNHKVKSEIKENESHSSSTFQRFLNVMLFYSAWSYFFDDDNE